MPATPIITTKKAAAVTSCDGLNLVSTTLSPPPGKDEDHDFVYHGPARRN